MLSGLGISFQNLNLLHFDQIISLKSLSINLFLLAKLRSSVDEAPGPSLTEGTVFREREREQVRERERKKERERGCLNSVRTYLPGTVLQEFSCLSGVTTHLPALCCRGAAV